MQIRGVWFWNPEQSRYMGVVAEVSGAWKVVLSVVGKRTRNYTPHPIKSMAFPGRNPRNTTQHNTTQHNTTQHNTTQHNTTQHNTTQHNTSQRNTTQHKTRQDKTTQRNTTQHSSDVGGMKPIRVSRASNMNETVGQFHSWQGTDRRWGIGLRLGLGL
jgi:hypothetical protein